jgi:hypothetical protein
MRRALIVGIDEYDSAPLAGCVNDATAMATTLSRHENNDPNFDCKLLTAGPERVTRSSLRASIGELFAHPADVALFYFSGHGTVNNLGGFLVTQDARRYDEGVAMRDVLALANSSSVKEIVIVLDCCHSGSLGAVPGIENDHAVLREGVSVLTASGATQASVEVGGRGVFTSLVCEALGGGAADVIGRVTVASVYAFVDQALGPWDQRPLFKSHVSRLIPLRMCQSGVAVEVLRQLPRYFPTADFELRLDPSYEPDADPRGHPNESVFADLQKLRAAHLVVPVGEEHMYFAAMNNKTCRLTALGRHYWQLAQSGRL